MCPPLIITPVDGLVYRFSLIQQTKHVCTPPLQTNYCAPTTLLQHSVPRPHLTKPSQKYASIHEDCFWTTCQFWTIAHEPNDKPCELSWVGHHFEQIVHPVDVPIVHILIVNNLEWMHSTFRQKG